MRKVTWPPTMLREDRAIMEDRLTKGHDRCVRKGHHEPVRVYASTDQEKEKVGATKSQIWKISIDPNYPSIKEINTKHPKDGILYAAAKITIKLTGSNTKVQKQSIQLK